jgi:hypothetical protein
LGGGGVDGHFSKDYEEYHIQNEGIVSFGHSSLSLYIFRLNLSLELKDLHLQQMLLTVGIVKPVLRGHILDKEKVVFYDR